MSGWEARCKSQKEYHKESLAVMGILPILDLITVYVGQNITLYLECPQLLHINKKLGRCKECVSGMV